MPQKKPNSRIYVVEEFGGDRFLIRATTKARAVRYVARNNYKAAVATQDDIVALVSEGQSVEDAVETDDDEPRQQQQVAA